MKLKLISLLIAAVLVMGLAAGCAKQTANNGDSATTSVVTSVNESATISEGTTEIKNDDLAFMNDGEIRVDVKLAEGHSLDGFKFKINGEEVVFGTAKAYNGEVEITLEGSISFPLTAKFVLTNGKNSNFQGGRTANDNDGLPELQERLNTYASTLQKSAKKMYILLTDDKDANWFDALNN